MWPFRKPVERRHSSYADGLIAAAEAAAGTTTVARPSATAAEAAAGIVGPATAAVTADVLHTAGRELVTRGECLFRLAWRRGALRLDRCSHWDVHGDGPDEETWSYNLTLTGPSNARTIRAPAANVVHLRWSTPSEEPWRGRGPLQGASLTGRVLAETELALGDESAGPRGNLIPVPDDPDAGGEDDPDDPDSTAALRATITGLKGKTALVPTTSGGWGDADEAPGRGAVDWAVRRLGAAPGAPLVSLRDGAAMAILAACGVPVELVSGGDGTALREAWRRFLHSTVQPLAGVVAVELARKLDTPGLALSFEGLFASDLSGRARAFQSLVGGGMEPARAAGLAGLMEE